MTDFRWPILRNILANVEPGPGASGLIEDIDTVPSGMC